MDERELNKSSGGPRIERSGKETRRFGKRIIFVFLLVLAGGILGINAQVRFKSGGVGHRKCQKLPYPSGVRIRRACRLHERRQEAGAGCRTGKTV
jgi:hypothetical protein